MELVLFLEVHQPLRMRPVLLHPPGSQPSELQDLFEWEVNREIFRRVAENVYLKTSRLLLESLRENEGFKVTFSLSGLVIEAMERWRPEVLDIFARMLDTGRVELVAQTYYHSIAWLLDRQEFVEQVREHVNKLREVFGYVPRAAENTEFIYDNDLACTLHKMGFRATVTEGVEQLRGFRGPNHVYRAWGCDIRVLLRNYRLSDDVGFRFSQRQWDQYPLTADKYVSWISSSPGEVVTIAMDYETFGEHHQEGTGIREFLRWLPREARRRGVKFSTLSEAALGHEPVGAIDVPPWSPVSWADERDVSAWLGNEVQRVHAEALRSLYPYAKALGGDHMRLWRLMSVSDHFYYQATKTGPAGEVHSYFNPYGSPYVAQLLYQRALALFLQQLREGAQRDPCRFLERFRAPDHLCFYPSDPAEGRACSLEELLQGLERGGAWEEHLRRGHIERWAREVLLIDLQRALDCKKL
ncbi:MAG: glycoside hydrolase family 57 protein [Acidilobaceae archaeon]|nr:glycoside hydrolase family 57 protein [Acidilobaceae archaeon]MCX8165264.1 glycoside hydrolase family 57 protein [Acidilobaceae archaeon]MDW7973690.1 glycoside hydrolase family 57 protein [Sulfolobales archaeon]